MIMFLMLGPLCQLPPLHHRTQPTTHLLLFPSWGWGTPSATQFRLSIASPLPPSGASLKLSSKHTRRYFYSLVYSGHSLELLLDKGDHWRSLRLLMESLTEDLINYFMRVNLERNIILEVWKHLDMRRCGDEEDATAVVRGATSRASRELPRLRRLETHRQEALTGTTATWGWEATAEFAVSKQTSAFICFDLRSAISHTKKNNFRQRAITRFVCHTSLIYNNFYNTVSCADFLTNTKRIFFLI